MADHTFRIFSTRNALLLGFGGLLLLLILSGLAAVQALSQMRRSNEQVRQEFLKRAQKLQQIRSGVYLSGTYLRDYLLEPDPAVAERHRASLTETKRQVDDDLAGYRALLRPEQTQQFQRLENEFGAYWASLAPVLSWDGARRQRDGYAFLRDEVFPRRMNMLGIADRIDGLNQQELTAGDQRLSEEFGTLRDRLLIVLLIAVALGLTQATTSIRQILRLERATAHHLNEVTKTREELRDLSARLVEAQENERKALSRELHDAVGQSLSAVLFELRSLSAALPADGSAELRDRATSIRKLVEGSVAMVRNMALLLRPSMLDDLGLLAALEWQAREVSKQTGMMVSVAAAELPDELPDEHKTCIFRVVQEALHNATKHASAQAVKITVARRGERIELEVRDDGKGFDPRRQRGLGLIGIQERVEKLGGVFRAESAPGDGTLLAVTLPFPGGGA